MYKLSKRVGAVALQRTTHFVQHVKSVRHFACKGCPSKSSVAAQSSSKSCCGGKKSCSGCTGNCSGCSSSSASASSSSSSCSSSSSSSLYSCSMTPKSNASSAPFSTSSRSPQSGPKDSAPSDKPFRFPLAWKEPAFYDEARLEEEMRRVSEVCHGCRRCFNLCQSFPSLFDMIDVQADGELADLPSSAFKEVVDNCTLCDLCFLSVCPYVPPHPLNIDFPHLMLRYRAIENKKKNEPYISSWSTAPAGSNPIHDGVLDPNIHTEIEVNAGVDRTLTFESPSLMDAEIAKTDRNGIIASLVAPIANWATKLDNPVSRRVLDKVAGIHPEAVLPQYQSLSQTLDIRLQSPGGPWVNTHAPAYRRRKAVIFATCLGQYNQPEIAQAALGVLRHNGVETEVCYPRCCAMPQLEQGDIAAVAEAADEVSAELCRYIDRGYDVISLIPSCSLMLKLEWPLIVPENANVKKLSENSFDICEYIVSIAKKEGLTPGLQPLAGGVTLHFACHSRAQNMGNKAAELLRLTPNAEINIVEKCSGHGGSWGCKSKHFETAMKVGKNTFSAVAKGIVGAPPRSASASPAKKFSSTQKLGYGRKQEEVATAVAAVVAESAPVPSSAAPEAAATSAAPLPRKYLASECPLAGAHIVQGLEKSHQNAADRSGHESFHPIVLFAQAYGMDKNGRVPSAQ